MSILTRHTPGSTSEFHATVQDSAVELSSDFSKANQGIPGLIGRCANPECRSGWVHLFRSRSRPVFEGGWTCSPPCTEAVLWAALCREFEGREPAYEPHRHRIPLGLLMMEHGWITSRQLRNALETQKAAGTGRLGEWLVLQHATDETSVTRALGLQWSCPAVEGEIAGAAMLTSLMPRLFLDAFGALPVRVIPGKSLYIGFEQCLDPVLALAASRMLGIRVDCAIVPSSIFHKTRREMFGAEFPATQLVEAISEAAAVHLMARSIERHQPANARLVRVRDCLWLRMWLERNIQTPSHVGSVHDVLCSVGSF